MESNNKNKKNTVWIILTCVFALTTLVLGMALYRSQSDRKLLERESAGGSTGCGGSDNGSATTTGRSR